MADDQTITLTQEQVDDCARQIIETNKNPVLTIDGESVTLTKANLTEQSYSAIVAVVETQNKAKAAEQTPASVPASKAQEAAKNDTEFQQAAERDTKDLNGDTTTQVQDAAQDGLLPGGVVPPDGYRFLHSFSQTGGETGSYDFGDLGDKVNVITQDGISAVMEGHLRGRESTKTDEGQSGTLRVRIIHDFALRVYIFRKDEHVDGLDVTTFYLNIGHGAPPLTA